MEDEHMSTTTRKHEEAPPPRIPDGTAVHVRSDHFAGECDAVVTAADYDGGWLYRVDVTTGDRLDGERNEQGELWLCEFEVHALTENA
jgi:hypothetical protein